MKLTPKTIALGALALAVLLGLLAVWLVPMTPNFTVAGHVTVTAGIAAAVAFVAGLGAIE